MFIFCSTFITSAPLCLPTCLPFQWQWAEGSVPQEGRIDRTLPFLLFNRVGKEGPRRPVRSIRSRTGPPQRYPAFTSTAILLPLLTASSPSNPFPSPSPRKGCRTKTAGSIRPALDHPYGDEDRWRALCGRVETIYPSYSYLLFVERPLLD